MYVQGYVWQGCAETDFEKRKAKVQKTRKSAKGETGTPLIVRLVKPRVINKTH